MPSATLPAGQPDDPVGVVLAGGGSRRFGTPKGLARVGGERIVDRVVHALGGAAADLLLVANAPEAGDWLPGVPLIGDAIGGGGGLSGVHAALLHTGRPVLVVAWDMPFVTTGLLRALVGRRAAAGADACYPESASPFGLEPFCACYAPSCLAPLETALRTGNAGGAQFARSLSRVARLSAREAGEFGDPGRLFFSVNSPDDLPRAEAMAAGAL